MLYGASYEISSPETNLILDCTVHRIHRYSVENKQHLKLGPYLSKVKKLSLFLNMIHPCVLRLTRFSLLVPESRSALALGAGGGGFGTSPNGWSVGNQYT